MTDTARHGAVLVYDPTTGLATTPVAAVEFTDIHAHIRWLPTGTAKDLHAELADHDPGELAAWTINHIDSNGAVTVEVVDDVDDVAELQDQLFGCLV